MRLRKLGCHISVNERMLATKRGREYARQMPLGRLHLETDAPAQPGSPYSAEELESSLNRTLNALARIRGIEQLSLIHISSRCARGSSTASLSRKSSPRRRPP